MLKHCNPASHHEENCCLLPPFHWFGGAGNDPLWVTIVAPEGKDHHHAEGGNEGDRKYFSRLSVKLSNIRIWAMYILQPNALRWSLFRGELERTVPRQFLLLMGELWSPGAKLTKS